jgi:hypothetical protein
MAKSPEFIALLPKYADEYIKECVSHTKEVVSGSGKVLEVRDRHIPTIDYFLTIWLPMYHLESIHRDTYYTWMKGEDQIKSDAIKKIDDKFKALATDIVANEGKGIFYAKNRLGMHDKQHIENKNVDKFDFDN